jgi:hypothetical protein
MINRRFFLRALAAVPFLGKAAPPLGMKAFEPFGNTHFGNTYIDPPDLTYSWVGNVMMIGPRTWISGEMITAADLNG